ncbi:MAG: SOUL family heme-binding protein [Verrucomicrobiota bacterium]
MKRMWLWIFIGVVAVVLLLAGFQTSRARYESAPYKVVRSDGKFELRDYPALTVVETPTAVASGSDGSFMRLFRFITGGNEAKQKIAMTTPVFMSGSGTNTTMAFVLPAKMKASEVPKPSDGAVTVRELAAGRFAVLRYRGGRNAKNEAESLARLKTWMESEQLSVLSPPVYGYFDPPWTPAFLRRNEVMLRTEAGK